MKNIKKFMALTLGMACLLPVTSQVVSADTIDFNLHVTREDHSVSTKRVAKSDWEPAVANILRGLGGGKKVRIRAWTVAENEPATQLKVAVANGRHTLHYKSGYGTVGRFYYLNASKYGWLDSTIIGRFAP